MSDTAAGIVTIIGVLLGVVTLAAGLIWLERRLLALWQDRDRASKEVKRLALAHVAALETKAESLRTMAASLRHLAAHCHGDARPDCPILDDLARKE